MTKILLAALLAVCCAGCGTTEKVASWFSGGKDNSEPPSPLVEFRPRLNVVRLWSEGVGSGTDDQYLKLEPAVAGQRLFTADSDGEVVALDASNGKTLWSEDVDEHITGGPGFGENVVLVGTGEGEVIALNADSGKKLWRSRVSSEVLSPPIKADGTVVVRTNDGRVFGMAGDTGKRLWTYDRTVPALTLRGTSAPLVSGGIVIAGFDAGRLAALDLPTGRLIWETSVATSRGRSELERMVDIDSEPLLMDGIIYVATFQGQIAAVQLESGRILWNREISSYAGFTADESYLYLSNDQSHVLAFDRFTGTVIWRQEKLHARAATGPASIGDYVVVGDLEGYLHWMDKATGDFVARTQLSGARIIVKPIVVGKVLYAYASDGTLAAYTYH
ncbi:MAG: outer membrane protein assembly factor BamB [Gammaproteobacteria bacterium]|nr:outer membrane protein assembly factor BamB [Gammaproteobacteria bacterium]